MQYQLRDYEITPGAMTEFVTEWRTQVVPLRVEAGFEIVGAWSNPETNRFVWIVAHEGDFEEADRVYYESPGRRGLSPDPSRFIDKARSEFVSPAT
ncbi:MAG: NIPSNAP family protein [Acidobacteria bacterium]|nr:NIPSNAP family protein [Acidobacteriota bacterium]